MKLILTLLVIAFLSLGLQIYSFVEGWETWIPDVFAVTVPLIALVLVIRQELFKKNYDYVPKVKK